MEHMIYGHVGTLRPCDIVFDQADRACFLLQGDGTILLRLKTEPAFPEGLLVWNDGSVHVTPLQCWGETERYRYWQTTIHPGGERLVYSFAFRDGQGAPVYLGRHGQTHAVESPFMADLATLTPMSVPEWAQGAVIYQIFPDRFDNGDPANDLPDTAPWGSPPTNRFSQGGDLAGIVRRLDYLSSLGVDVLYLNPIFLSPTTHKYDCVDYYQVDPVFGGNEALRALVAAAHDAGMRVVLDASFNHCHPRFFAFQDVMAHGPRSPYWDWFTIHEWPLRVRSRPHAMPANYWMTGEEREAYLAAFSAGSGIPVEEREDDGPHIDPTYEAWYNVLNMPKINQDNQAARAYFLDVTRHWLQEYDIDGWRMDVAQHVPDSFWPQFRQAAREIKPDAYLLSEIWGDTSDWLQGDMFDATMNYTFRGLCLEYFATETLGTGALVDGLQEMLMMYAPPVGLANQNLLSSHDTARFRRLAGEREERWRLATLFQMTVPGAPGIYYGDEIGLTGANDLDCRSAFPWHAPESWDEEALAWTRGLVHARRELPALRLGDWQAVWTGVEGFAFLRRFGTDRVLVTIARRERLAELRLPVVCDGPRVVWGRGTVAAGDQGLIVRDVPAYDGLIIAL
jgi:glycosidase